MDSSFLQVFLPTLLMGLCALSGLCLHRNLWSPGSLIAIYWLFAVLFPFLLEPHLPVRHEGIWALLALVTSASIGAAIVPLCIAQKCATLHSHRSNLSEKQCYKILMLNTRRKKYLRRVIVFSSFIGLLGVIPVVCELEKHTGALPWFKPLNAIKEIALNASKMRYQDHFVPPILTKISWLLMYTSALFGGIYLSIAKRRIDIFIGLSANIVGVVYVILLTTKSTLILTIILTLGSYLTGKVSLMREKKRIINKRSLFYIALASAIVLVIFFNTQALRYGYGFTKNEHQKEVLWNKMKTYATGHVVSFTNWFAKNYTLTKIPTGFGKYTFAGPLDLIGVSDRMVGGFKIEDNHSSFINSNIFTVWRGIISDFTLPGAILLTFLISGIAQYVYVIASKTAVSLICLPLYYSFVLYSFLISIFQYNTICGAFFIYSFGILILKSNVTIQHELEYSRNKKKRGATRICSVH